MGYGTQSPPKHTAAQDAREERDGIPDDSVHQPGHACGCVPCTSMALVEPHLGARQWSRGSAQCTSPAQGLWNRTPIANALRGTKPAAAGPEGGWGG